MKNHDLNLLKALNALIATESITQMGEHLGITQPAASRVMTRLRRAFADPLLVRTSKGYVLTPRAKALGQTTREALAIADQVFSATDFDPQISRRQFRVASTDYGSMVVQASWTWHCTLTILCRATSIPETCSRKATGHSWRKTTP
jgi:DNA-binding transcriptional LysR family regulator